MYSIERKTEIIKILEHDGKIDVNTLAERFHTSKETIRRDLKNLESQGVLKRTHGGAVSNRIQDGSPIQEYPLAIRKIQNHKEKQALCQQAVSYIKNGDIIFVDNSSTTMYLAQFIPAGLSVTFLTNSVKFLTEASQYDCSNKTLICLGGMFNPKNLSTYATDSLVNVKDYYPDKCFISCAGISQEHKLTDTSLYELNTKKHMIEASKEVFLLADHTKFDYDGQFFLSDFDSIQHIITDSQTDLNHYPYLHLDGLDLISVCD